MQPNLHQSIGPVRSILLAVDGGECSEYAVEEANMLAGSLDAWLSIVHVLDQPPSTFDGNGHGTRLPGEAPLCARRLVEKAMNRVPQDLRGEKLVCHGEPGPEIVKAAVRVEAGIIVLGKKAHTMPFALGRVAEWVVRHAHCPVLTVGTSQKWAMPHGLTTDAGAMQQVRGQGT